MAFLRLQDAPIVKECTILHGMENRRNSQGQELVASRDMKQTHSFHITGTEQPHNTAVPIAEWKLKDSSTTRQWAELFLLQERGELTSAASQNAACGSNKR